MSNPYAAAYPYHDGTYHERCPNCGKCNEVEVTKQDGHNEPEEYSCAGCGHKLGTHRASLTPRTSLVDDSLCGTQPQGPPPAAQS
jgi:hypothetical protein